MVSWRKRVRNGWDGAPVGVAGRVDQVGRVPEHFERACRARGRCHRGLMPSRSASPTRRRCATTLVLLVGVDGGEPAASACVSAPWVVERRKTRSRVGPQPAELHDLAPPDQRGEGEAVGHALAEGGEVGPDAVGRLRAAEVPAEAGDHLVEDEERAVGVARGRSPPGGSPAPAPRRWPPPSSRRRCARDARRTARSSAVQVVVVELERHGRRRLRGMPASIGVVPMNQSSVEKKGCSAQIATRSRPV